MTEPLEARCDDCSQIRPVFPYESDFSCMGGCTFPGCETCSPNQLMICIRCEDTRRRREERNG